MCTALVTSTAKANSTANDGGSDTLSTNAHAVTASDAEARATRHPRVIRRRNATAATAATLNAPTATAPVAAPTTPVYSQVWERPEASSTSRSNNARPAHTATSNPSQARSSSGAERCARVTIWSNDDGGCAGTGSDRSGHDGCGAGGRVEVCFTSRCYDHSRCAYLGHLAGPHTDRMAEAQAPGRPIHRVQRCLKIAA